MDLHLTLHGSRGLARQLYDQIKEAIVQGRLRAGDGLPASRVLAAQLGLSRNTVADAYERLSSEGFLTGRVGSGTFVSTRAHTVARKRRGRGPPALRPRALWDAIPLGAERRARRIVYDFRVGTPDIRLFPYADWRRLVARQLRAPLTEASSYADPAGSPRLRAAIARHIGHSRGVLADPDDVIITSGTQQALDLIGKVLLDPGSRVGIETPGYPPAWWAFRAQQAELVAVPVDSEGLKVGAVPEGTRLLYVTPSHQFPMGLAMSLSRRLELLAWAERSHAAVIEDDYDGEFRFGGRPLEALHSLDRSGRVLYVGSFSKVLLPGLRLGYVVAPSSLREALRKARFTSDWHGPPVLQEALARFIEDGLFARHLRRSRQHYLNRRETLIDALQRRMGRWIELVPSEAGLHLTVLFLQPRLHARTVVAEAEKRGLALSALDRFGWGGRAKSGLVLGYGAVDVERIEKGVAELAKVVAEVAG